MALDATQKKILWGAGIGCVVLFALIVVGVVVLFGRFVTPGISDEDLDTPEAVGPVGVVVGKGLLTSREVFADEKLETVADIAFGKVDPDPKVAMVVVGATAADFVSEDMKMVSSVRFAAGGLDAAQVVDVEGDGICEFLARDDEPRLLGHDGKVRWIYEPNVPDGYASNACAGDLDGDGKLEFAVGFGGGGGVHVLDSTGRVRYSQDDGNVWTIATADLDGDGRAEIVHSNVGGELRIRDAQCRLKSARRLTGPGIFPHYLGDFTITRWPTSAGKPHVFYPTDKDFRVADAQGKLVARLQAPKVDDDCDLWATPVALREGSPEYVALLVCFFTADRSILYVYDASQKLVYHEVLPENVGALTTRPIPGTRAEALLVGGTGRVLEYRAAGEPQPGTVRH